MVPVKETSATAPTRRQQARQATVAEIKRTAFAQIAAEGLGGLSLNAIARAMGMTGPALYRYYPSRDDLVTDLLAETYAEFAGVASTAMAGAGPDPGERLVAAGHALRAWARAHPERYDLLYGRPLPGYVAPEEATRATAQGSLQELAGVWADLLGVGADDPVALDAAVLGWARLHGFISLELGGHFDGIPIDPDAVFAQEVAAMVARPSVAPTPSRTTTGRTTTTSTRKPSSTPTPRKTPKRTSKAGAATASTTTAADPRTAAGGPGRTTGARTHAGRTP